MVDKNVTENSTSRNLNFSNRNDLFLANWYNEEGYRFMIFLMYDIIFF